MLLVRIEAKEAVAISLYDALILAAAAWREVTPQVIGNCFRKGGFITTDDPEPAPTAASPDDADGSPTDDRQFRNVWDSVSRHFGVQLPFMDFVAADDVAPTSAHLSDNELIAAARPSTSVPETEEEEDEPHQQQPDSHPLNSRGL